ncbi:Panacea domain-containing protein [Cytobacillus kochii]|uniref:Panacea domain-containing protein n=1 Tax=Cytobacillus TaxID=2675230 RepID=UPI001CD3815A|nr:type II toxin-antitoxin system antitoxin SocA domain-containing protein [Cytobacillus kochii]MCA1029213.1 DUF4065 domain-containing protein [Cytobacillus kochii]
MTNSAHEIAKWFIKQGYDQPKNTFDGNMKLQKLLFFSQLIHAAKYGEVLFSEEMRAFENGTVINSVRLDYKNSYYELVEEAQDFEISDNEEVLKTLKNTVEIFGDMSAKELSHLNHELESWKVPYYESLTPIPGVYSKEKNIVNPYNEVFLKDVEKVRDMLEVYEDNGDYECEVINGISFYYYSEEVTFTDEIVSMLENLDCPDSSYFITYDEEQGYIIS